MSCKLEDRRPDWKSYALGELDARARQEAESHVAACADCQDELAGLRVTLDAMATLREEELPRRIAFVSDKVFEPRWYEKFSQAFLRPSFAAAGVDRGGDFGACVRAASKYAGECPFSSGSASGYQSCRSSCHR